MSQPDGETIKSESDISEDKSMDTSEYEFVDDEIVSSDGSYLSSEGDDFEEVSTLFVKFGSMVYQACSINQIFSV